MSAAEQFSIIWSLPLGRLLLVWGIVGTMGWLHASVMAFGLSRENRDLRGRLARRLTTTDFRSAAQ